MTHLPVSGDYDAATFEYVTEPVLPTGAPGTKWGRTTMFGNIPVRPRPQLARSRKSCSRCIAGPRLVAEPARQERLGVEPRPLEARITSGEASFRTPCAWCLDWRLESAGGLVAATSHLSMQIGVPTCAIKIEKSVMNTWQAAIMTVFGGSHPELCNGAGAGNVSRKCFATQGRERLTVEHICLEFA